jgi:hypothetical protein
MSVELGALWVVRPPWDEASVRETHGAYVTHRESELQLHVRGGAAGAIEELEATLRAQQWGSPPFDTVARRIGATAIVGGTFPYFARGFVREWFVSNGVRGANAAALFKADTPATLLGACESLLDTTEWDA